MPPANAWTSGISSRIGSTGDGALTGHNGLSCKWVPAYLQWPKQSRHPLSVLPFLCGVNLTATCPTTQGTVLKLEGLLNGLKSLDEHYRPAKGDQKLSPAALAVSREAHQLVSAHKSSTPTPCLLEASLAPLPVVDIDGMINAFGDYRCSARQCNFNKVEVEDHGNVRILHEAAVTDLETIKGVSLDWLKSEAMWFAQAAKTISTSYKTDVPMNEDGMPTLFWRGASTRSLLLISGALQSGVPKMPTVCLPTPHARPHGLRRLRR